MAAGVTHASDQNVIPPTGELHREAGPIGPATEVVAALGTDPDLSDVTGLHGIRV